MHASPTGQDHGVTQRPDVSVVIPTWNRAVLLPPCVAGLASQDYPADKWELVVVDDGSTDTTAAVMAGIQQDPAIVGSGLTIRYLPLQHVGLNAARNAGIKEASGQLICFLDDDVLTPPDWLSSLVSGVAAHPGAAAYGGPIELVIEGRTPRSCGREELGETTQGWGPEVCEPTTLFGSNLAITRDAVERYGFFDTDIVCGSGDETEWLTRVKRQGGKLLYLPDARVMHRRRPEDLRLRRLWARRFSRGRGQIASADGTGESYRLASEISQVLRSLVHSARHGCALGLLPVATSGGRVVGLVSSGKLRAP